MSNIKVLFHSYGNGRHCPDGFGASYAAWAKFGDEAEYIPCVYGEPSPQIDDGDTVYLVDFSYPRDVLLGMADIATAVVLDHHKTAQAALEGLDFATFDMNRSGAQLAWDYFHPTTVEPLLISYVADRDLWLKKLPYTEEVHRALGAFVQDFQVWDVLANLRSYLDIMVRIGTPLYEAHTQAVKQLAATAVSQRFAEHPVLCTNTDNYALVSDALSLLCHQHPQWDFAMNFWLQGNGTAKVELRSVGDFDVSEIAKRFGGGGHRNAAGCTVKESDLWLMPYPA